MKLSLDKKENLATITLQHINDLFYLYLLVDKEDEIFAWTYRQKRVTNHGQQVRGEREKVYLGIKVEKIYFHPFTDSLKVVGIVSYKPEELILSGHHHSFNIKVGDTIKLKKYDWDSIITKSILKRIKEVYPTTLIVSVEYFNIAIGILTNLGLKIIYTQFEDVSGKRHSFDREKALDLFMTNSLKEIKKAIVSHNPDLIILYGPGILKDKVYDEIKKEANNIFKIAGSVGGVEGLYESLRNENVLKLLSNYTDYEDLFILTSIQNNPEKVAIGMEEVKKAASLGSIEKLVISTEYLKSLEKDKLVEIKKIGEEVVSKGGIINLVYEDTTFGDSLLRLGNIVAILRYQLEFSKIL